MTAEKRFLDIPEEDILRANLYDFLSITLARSPDRALLERCAAFEGDQTPLGQAVRSLSAVAKSTTPKSVEREFNALFIGLGRGEILPYASYYMTGFLNEKPLAVLRNDMSRLGMSRAENVFEPEDNIASLCEMMAGLILGRFGAPAGLSQQREFFNRHIGPWAEHMFSDLEGAKSSVFYAAIGKIGHCFIGIEKEAFRMTAGATV